MMDSGDTRGEKLTPTRGVRQKRAIAKSNGGVRGGHVANRGRAKASAPIKTGKTPDGVARSAKKSVKKPKTEKRSNARGYDADAAVDDAEYHYGSDFFSEEDEVTKESQDSGESEIDIDDHSDEEESILDDISDVGSSFDGPISRSPTPMPVWLQGRIDLPNLDLPPSSDDLLVPREYVMRALSVYELMTRFRRAFRLSPFRIEDFCAALAAEEQSSLMCEVHVQLLKAIMRNCDAQQIMLGPPDLRDVINVNFYFLDAMTWPAVLKAFFESHEKFSRELKIVTENNYPYCEVGDRLTVIETLVEELIDSDAVREIINSADGKVEHEDHCRSCHALGELLCCDTCTAVYHEECVVPRLTEEPTQGWQCPVCLAEKVPGVTDCLKPEDRYAVRQQSLGFDRHGRKYWFLCRRLVIEHEAQTWYYSTEAQFEELLTILDPDDFEDKLCEKLVSEQETLRQHMQLTLELTEMHRVHGKPLYLTTEIEEAKRRMEDRKYASEAAEKQKAEEEAAALADQLEVEQAAAAAQLEGLNAPKDETLIGGEKKTDDLVAKLLETVKSGGMTTRMRSGVIQPIKYTLLEETKKAAPVQRIDHSRPRVVGPYKLGTEGNHKHYKNQYAENPLALSKAQHQEEKERRQQLVRKFALSQSAEFEWTGVVNGTETMSILTLRNTIEKLLGALEIPFFHGNWPKILPVWSKNLRDASLADEFRVLLTILAQVIKSPVYMSIWNDGSGHTRFHLTTNAERELLKKREKKEQKEREALEEKCKVMGTFVKYTLGLKHQVARLKGEDYRVHGEGGWYWKSRTRAKRTMDSRTRGLRAGPARCLVQTSAGFECLSVEEMQRRAQRFASLPLGSVPNDVMDELGDIFSPEDDEAEKMDTSEPSGNYQPALLGREKLMEMLPQPDAETMGLIDISTALSFYPAEGVINDQALAKRRTLYPKFGTPALLDNLLASRMAQLAADGQNARRFIIRRKPQIEEPVEPFKGEVFPEFEVHSAIGKGIVGAYKEKAKHAKESDPLLTSFFNEILTLGKTTYFWAGSKISCYVSNCPNRKPKSSENQAATALKCYSPMCRLRVESSQLMGDLKHILMKMKAHKDSVKKEREKIERERVEKRKKMTDADPEPGDIVIYKCQEKVHLRPEYLAPGFPAKKNLAKKQAGKGGQTMLIPLSSRFRTTNGESSCLIPPAYETRRCARKKGRGTFSGYLYNAKPFPHYFWPYPCPRPSFKTTWLWKTSKMTSIHDAALQMRLLWASLRWDAIHTKPPPESKMNQVQLLADNSEVRRTDILGKKHVGEFLDKTEFLVRRVVVPADLTKATVRDVQTPARSGLRARRSQLVETHTQEPKTLDVSIPEEQLELWELKQYHEKGDKAMAVAKAREKDNANREQFIALTMARVAKDKENAASRHQAAEAAAAKAREEQKKVKIIVQGQPMTEINPAAWVASGAKLNAEVALEEQPRAPEPQLPAPSIVRLVNADGSRREPEQLTAMMEDNLRQQRDSFNKRRLKDGSVSSAIFELRKRELGATAASLFGGQAQQPKLETLSLRNASEAGRVQFSRTPDGKLIAHPVQTSAPSLPTMALATAFGGVLPPGKVLEFGGRRIVIAGRGSSTPAPMPRILLPPGTSLSGKQIPLPTHILNALRQVQAQQQMQVQLQQQQQQQQSQEALIQQTQPEQPQPEPESQVHLPEPQQSEVEPQQQQIQLTTSGPMPKEQRLILTQTADGKLNVSGLLPGQQIVRTADGVFHLVCADPNATLAAQQQLQQQQRAEEQQNQLQMQSNEQPEPFVEQHMVQPPQVAVTEDVEESFGLGMTQEQQQHVPEELHMAHEHLDGNQLMIPQQDQQGLQQHQMGEHDLLPPTTLPEEVSTGDLPQRTEDLLQQQLQNALLQQQLHQQQQDALLLQQEHEALARQQQQHADELLQAELRRLQMEQQQLHEPQFHPEFVAQQQIQAGLAEEQQQHLALQQAALQAEQHMQQQQLGMPPILQERVPRAQPAPYPVRSDYDFSKPPKARPKKKDNGGPIVQIRPGPNGPSVHSSVDLTARQKVALRALLPNAMKTVQDSNQSIFIRLPAADVFEPKLRCPMTPTAAQNDLGLTEAQLQPQVDENDLRAALAQITRNAPKAKQRRKKPTKPTDEHGFACTRRPSDFMTSPVPREPESPVLSSPVDPQKYMITADYLKQTIQAALKQGNLSEDMAKRLHELQRIQAEKEREAAEAAVAAAAAAAATAEVAAAVMHHPPSPLHEVEYDSQMDGPVSPSKKKTGGAKRRPEGSPVPAPVGEEEIVEVIAKEEDEKGQHPERTQLLAYVAELRKDIMKKRIAWELSISHQFEMKRERSRARSPAGQPRRPSPPPLKKYPASPPKKRTRSRDKSRRREERRGKSSKSKRSDHARSKDKKRKKSRGSPRRAVSPRRGEPSRKRKRSPSPSPPPRKRPSDAAQASRLKKPKLSTGTFKTPSFGSRPKKDSSHRKSPAAAAAAAPPPAPASASSPTTGTPTGSGGTFDWAIKGRPAPKMKNSLASKAKQPLVGSRKRKAGAADSKYVRPAKIQKTTVAATPTTASAAASPKTKGAKPDEAVYCLCKTPYDNKKFYIGCDSCEDWYHGACVNVTEAQASSMKEFVCPLCTKKRKDELKVQNATEGSTKKQGKRKSAKKGQKATTDPAPVVEPDAFSTAVESRGEEAPIEAELIAQKPPVVQEKAKRKVRKSAKAAAAAEETTDELVQPPPAGAAEKAGKKGKNSATNALAEQPPPAAAPSPKQTPKSPVKAPPKTPAANKKSKKASNTPAATSTTKSKGKQAKTATPAADKEEKIAAETVKSPTAKSSKAATPKQTSQAGKGNKKTPAVVSPKKAAATPKVSASKKSEPKTPAAKKDSKTPASIKDSKTPAAAKKNSSTATPGNKKASGGKKGSKAVGSESGELYCLCRKPYDQTKFYICCDRCGDWFHGTCVGIIPLEANDIDEYMCPNCGPKTPLNCANFALLKPSSFNDLKTMLEEIKAIKYAAEFVDTTELQKDPFYKKVIKEPADIKLMEAKLENKEYRSMKEFIADLIRIFTNCRVYHPDNSEQCKNAAKLELDVVKKIKAFRMKIAKNLSIDSSAL